MSKWFRLTMALIITLSTLSVSGSALAQGGTPACDPNAVCFDVTLYPAGITADFYINGQMVAQNVNNARLVGKKDGENIAEARNIKDNFNQGYGDLYTYADIKTPIFYSTYFYPVLNYVKGTLQVNISSTSFDAIVGDVFVDGAQVATQVATKNVNVAPGKHVVEVKNVVDPKAGGKYKYDNASQETFVNPGPYGAFVYLYLNRNWLSGFLAVTCILNGKGINDDAKCAINENDAKIDTIENYATSSTSLSSGDHNVSVSVIGAQANKWGAPIASKVKITSTPYGPGTTYLTATFDLKPNAPPTAATGAAAGGVTVNSANVDRVVLADYMMWYDNSTFDGNKTWDVPRDGGYNSDDMGIIQKHVAMAQQACLNGFAAHWYGPNEGRTTGNFNKLMQASAGTNLRHAIVIQTNILPGANDGSIADAIRYVINNWSNSGNYLKLGGKPVIFFTDMPRPWGSDEAALAAWKKIRNDVDPQGKTIWMAEGLYPTFNPPFDGLYVYRIDHKDYPQSWLKQARWAAGLRQVAQLNNAYYYFADTIAAGFDDLKSVNAPGDLRSDAPHFARDRQDGQYYRDTYNSALYTGGDFLLVKSFNEWIEGTEIEPGKSYGDKYLNLTCEFANGYRNR